MRWLGLETAQQLGVLAAPEEDTNDLVALAPGDWAPLSLVLALRNTHLHTDTNTYIVGHYFSVSFLLLISGKV